MNFNRFLNINDFTTGSISSNSEFRIPKSSISYLVNQNDLDFDAKKLGTLSSIGYTESLNSLGIDEKLDTKTETFLDSLAITFSILYAIALVAIGIVVYIFDLFGGSSKLEQTPVGQIGEAFDMYLCLAGIIILSILIFDINKYLKIVKESHNQKENPIKLIEGENGELIVSIPLTQSKPTNLPQYYLFSNKRHAGSFFFKIGATIFWLGHTIHMLIIFTREILYLKNNGNESSPSCGHEETHCSNPVALVNALFQVVYFGLQLFMIVKFSNVIVNRSKRLARICFMHCMASSFCFWLRAIINETEDSFVKHIIANNTIKDRKSLKNVLFPK